MHKEMGSLYQCLLEEFIQHSDMDLAIDFRLTVRLNYYSFTYIIIGRI